MNRILALVKNPIQELITFNSCRLINFSILILGVLGWVIFSFQLNNELDSLEDEGFILLSYNNPVPGGIHGTQAPYMINRILNCFPYNVMSARWLAFLFQLISTLIFLFSSYLWLQKKNQINIDKYLYAGIFLMVGSLSLHLFPKSVSYNHLQQFNILIIISLYLLYDLYFSVQVLNTVLLLGIGLNFFNAFINIPPSGVASICIVSGSLIIISYPSFQKILKVLFCVFCGSLLSAFLYHIFVRDLLNIYNDFSQVISGSNYSSRGYDFMSLGFKLLKSILSLFIVSLTGIAILSIYDLLILKKIKPFLIYCILIFIFILLTIYSLNYSRLGTINEWIIIPLIISLYMNLKENRSEFFHKKSNLAAFILLVSIPFIASLGTNLLLTSKIGFFFTTWFVASVLILEKNNGYTKNIHILIYSFIFLLITIPYIPKNKSYVKSTRLNRIENIKITRNQRDYFERVDSVLHLNGYNKKNDNIFVFQPDAMTVFAVGGKVENLFFLPGDFINSDFSKIERPKYLILNKYALSQIRDVVSNLWQFPMNYKQYNIGTPEVTNLYDANSPRILYILGQ